MKLQNYQCSLCYAQLHGNITEGNKGDNIEWSGVALGYIDAAQTFAVIPDMDHTHIHACNRCMGGLRALIVDQYLEETKDQANEDPSSANVEREH